MMSAGSEFAAPMRILVCASEAPFGPYNGLRLQIRALVNALSEHHDVHVVAAQWPDQEIADHEIADAPFRLTLLSAPTGGLARRLVGWSRALADHAPIESVNLLPRFAASVERLVTSEVYDVVHVSNGELAGLRPMLHGLPAVLAPLDAWERNVEAEAELASGLGRVVLAEQTRRVRRYVRRWYPDYDFNVLVTDEDANLTRRTVPLARVEAISNGVNLDLFTPGDPSRSRESGLIVFTGAMNFAPNVRAAQVLATDVLPRVLDEHPDARLALVGRDPGPEVLALAGPRVQVTGTVDDVRPWLWRAGAFVCPMVSGTGVKNKLLEAMACGVPSVVTPLACAGTAIVDERHALVAEDPNAMAQAIGRVLSAPGLAAELGAAGRRLVEDDHGWTGVARAYEQLYRRAVGC